MEDPGGQRTTDCGRDGTARRSPQPLAVNCPTRVLAPRYPWFRVPACGRRSQSQAWPYKLQLDPVEHERGIYEHID
jgi:hypothetical protein